MNIEKQIKEMVQAEVEKQLPAALAKAGVEALKGGRNAPRGIVAGGNVLKFLREHAGVDINDLAHEMGDYQGRILAFESGEKGYRVDVAKRYVDAVLKLAKKGGK